MKLAQIEYFLTLARELNFTAAAKSLFISQPSLSKQIVLLEQELETPLFYRNSRRVRLTAAGEQLRGDLEAVVAQLEQAKQRSMEVGKATRSVFRVGSMEGALFDSCLAELAEQLQALGMELSFSRMHGQKLAQALRQEEIDLALTLDLVSQYGDAITTQRYRRGDAALLFAKSFQTGGKQPETPEDFQKAPCLVLSRTVAPILYQQTLQDLKRVGLAPRRIAEMENYATLMTNLELGKGYALLSETVVIQHPRLRALPLKGIDGTWVVVAWRKHHPLAISLEKHFSHRCQTMSHDEP